MIGRPTTASQQLGSGQRDSAPLDEDQELISNKNNMPRRRVEPANGDEFGKILRRARRAAGLSVSEVANKCGLSQGYLSRVELGTAKPPSEQVVYAIARALQLDPLGLLEVAGLVPKVVKQAFFRTPDIYYLISSLPIRERQRLARKLREQYDTSPPHDNPSYAEIQRIKKDLLSC